MHVALENTSPGFPLLELSTLVHVSLFYRSVSASEFR